MAGYIPDAIVRFIKVHMTISLLIFYIIVLYASLNVLYTNAEAQGTEIPKIVEIGIQIISITNTVWIFIIAYKLIGYPVKDLKELIPKRTEEKENETNNNSNHL